VKSCQVSESRIVPLVGLFAIAIVISLVSCQSGASVDEAELNLRKQVAGELRDNNLFQAAIDEYRTILTLGDLTKAQQANINYLIARIYYEDLKDYENAAAFYMRARAYDPEGSFMAEASRNLVASLQKTGNLVDAMRELASATDIDDKPRTADDVPIARIDGHPIWRSEIERQIQSLPPETQKQFLAHEARINFAHQYVGVELLYRAAVREDYLNDPEIVRKKEQLIKSIVVDKYILDRVMPQITVDTLDVRNFYLANQSSRYNDAPYDSVKARVFLDYQQEKAATAYAEYINRLAQTENVEFLDHNW